MFYQLIIYIFYFCNMKAIVDTTAAIAGISGINYN